jgi:hypothetical protein
LHQEQGCAYLADVVLKVRGRFLAPFPIEFPELYERTLIHLQRLGLQKVLLAHGGQEPICFADFQTVLDSLPSLPKKRDVLASIFGKLIKV